MKNQIKLHYSTMLLTGILLLAGSCTTDENKTDPVITWTNPVDITIGTQLGATQLNAVADVPGTFVYTPPAGTILEEGLNQELKAVFTPADGDKYNIVTTIVKINVNDPANPAHLDLVTIPAGTFTMGSPLTEISRSADETQHQVTLSAFRINKYEITNAQFASFLNVKGVGNNGLLSSGQYPSEALIYQSEGAFDWGLHFSVDRWVPVEGFENYPVVNVTWFGANEFALYAGGSLPTEAQWEYACRANSDSPFSNGTCLLNTSANYNWAFPYGTCTNVVTKYPGATQLTGLYSANGNGIYDMHGNVWEWCSDWYGDYPTTAQNNPEGPLNGTNKVLRGGGWSNEAVSCRSAFRNFGTPSSIDDGVGFRVVKME